MDLRQLSYFIAVAEEGQFTRASLRVSVAQPAISAQIRRLERELGEDLFHRDQHGATLTEPGRALLPHAREALAAADAGRAAVASVRGLLHGRLLVGVSRPMDPRLTAVLGAFHRSYPAVDITLREDHHQPLVNALTAGELDAAVIGVLEQSPAHPIHSRVIAVDPLVLLVPRDHPLNSGRPVTVRQLRGQPMITLPAGSGLRAVIERACGDAGFTAQIAAETSDLTSLVALATEGLGATVLPRSAFADTELAVLPITRPTLRRHTALAWNPTRPSPAGRAFLALADDYLPPVDS